jgi:voltage-gated potassium channel
VLFAIIIILPYAYRVDHNTHVIFDRIEEILWVIFAVDYLFKLYLAHDKNKFIKHNFIELIIVAIPLFRPLRLLRLIPLIGYFLRSARKTLSGRVLTYAFMAAAVIVTPAVVIVYSEERKVANSNIKSLGDAIWWAFTTLTTVGYGDRYPVTTIGRVTAVFVMITGIGLVGVITASVASWFVKDSVENEDRELIKKIHAELQEIKEKLAEDR